MILKKTRPRIRFTEEGFAKVKADFDRLTEKRKGAIILLRTAREMGDLSENGAYKAARFEVSSIDRELRRLTYLLRFGQVTTSQNSDQIGFGHTVTLKSDTAVLTFMLVEGYESDPKQSKLSVHSPIGRAVVGGRKGDMITVRAPAGEITYTIIGFK